MSGRMLWIYRLLPLTALVAVAGMVLLARVNPLQNPDEAAHIRAAEYYLYTLVPPQIDSVQNNFSRAPSGFSYQDDFDIVYPLAGVFVRLVDWMPVTFTTKLRLFNLLLFSIMAIGSLSSRRVKANAPFFLFPQVWYTAAYFNGDIFPLFLSWYLVNRFAEWPAGRSAGVGKLVLSGMALGGLFVSKRNYLVLAAFLSLLGFAVSIRKRRWRELVAVVAVALCVVLIRVIPDFMVNGMDRADKVRAAREKNAFTIFKQSTPIEQRYFGFNLAERGVPVLEVLFEREWLIENLWSLTGKYGNAGLKSSVLFYVVFGSVILVFVSKAASPLFRVSRSGGFPAAEVMLSAWFVIFLFAMVGASFWHTMMVDFQPQGRYLFPGLAAAVLFVRLRQSSDTSSGLREVFVVSGLLVLAIHSFISSYLLSGHVAYRGERAVKRYHSSRYGVGQPRPERLQKQVDSPSVGGQVGSPEAGSD